jgi:hypothetical protein
MSRWQYIKNMKLSELSLKRVQKIIYNRLSYIPHLLAWNSNSDFVEKNKEGIEKYHNLYKGQRCFVVANGPSLKLTDTGRLTNELTFGMNRIFLSGFKPTFLVVGDMETMLIQFPEDFSNYPGVRFYNWKARNIYKKVKDILFLNMSYKLQFSKDLTKSCWAGHSVTYVCLQLAYYMGFTEVILIGKDHSYVGMGTPGQFVKADGKTQNHFIKDYFPAGKGWKIPNYKGEELAYTIAKKAFEDDGRVIYDATVDGKLDIFEKRDYDTFFNDELTEIKR